MFPSFQSATTRLLNLGNFLLKTCLRFEGSSVQSPLKGIRVCDMSRVLAGPYCSMILGDMGVEIIKIERPDAGDETRTFGPPFVNGQSCYFLSVNRNKKSVCVDIKTKAGQKIIHEFAETSDIFIENYLPGKLSSLNLSFEELEKLNEKIIYCSITGYGAYGEVNETKKPGYDIVASGIGGLTYVTGPKDGEPCRVGVAVTDIMTGMYAHGAILAALYQRERTNKGCKIDTSLLKTQVAMMSMVASDYLNAGVITHRSGNAHSSIVPYQGFQTADKEWIVIATANNKMFSLFCKAAGLAELLDDDRFTSNSDRVKNRNILIDIIEEKLLTQPIDHWLKVFSDANIPCGPINNIEQVFDMPQVRALNLIQTMQHPTAGSVRVSGPAVDFNGTSILFPPLPPPLLGEHTCQVLRDVLNYNEESIDGLLESKVCTDYHRSTERCET